MALITTAGRVNVGTKRAILRAAIRQLRRGWTPGTWAATGADGYGEFEKEYRNKGGVMVANDGTEIPVSKIEAVCAMGALECALATKGLDPEKSEGKVLMDEIRAMLDEQIRAYETESEGREYEKEYREYVARLKARDETEWIEPYNVWLSEERGFFYDGVEDWNDNQESPEPVIAVFERALASV